MNTIELLLSGQMEMSEFTSILKSDQSLQNQIKEFVPQEAVDNPSHIFWKQIGYKALENTEFDFYKLLLRLGKFNGTIGDNLNIFDIIRRGYTYHHPEINCTEKYTAAFDLYLDTIRDCFDGPEVRHVVERIIQDALPLKTKSKRTQQARAEVKAQFHLEDKKRPRWIQGAEWPMGENSPMAFISQKRHGELVEYFFRDADTGYERTVTQFY